MLSVSLSKSTHLNFFHFDSIVCHDIVLILFVCLICCLRVYVCLSVS